MPAIGGPPKTVAINGREFACAGDGDVSRKLGGFEKERQKNGDGTSRVIMTPISWTLGGVQVEVDNENGGQEFLEQVKNDPNDADIVITYADNADYAGTGSIEGELTYSNSSATCTFDLTGDGELKKL